MPQRRRRTLSTTLIRTIELPEVSYPRGRPTTERPVHHVSGAPITCFDDMNVPQIPGFHYDPVRRKYFKIVNGDQRQNSEYSNNTIRAESRRQGQQKEQQVKRHKVNGEAAATSSEALSQEVQRCRAQFHQNDFLSVRLGLTKQPPELMVRALRHLQPHKLPYSRVWPGPQPSTVFVAHLETVSLYELDSLLDLKDPQPIYTLRLFPDRYIDYEVGNQVNDIQCLDNWVLVQYGGTYSLLEWVFTGLSVRVTRLDDQLRTHVWENPDLSGYRDLLDECGPTRLHQNHIHVITHLGILLRISLHDFLFSIKKLKGRARRELMGNCKLEVCDEYWFWNSGRHLFVSHFPTAHSKTESLRFGRTIMGFFVNSPRMRISKLTTYLYQLYVVTHSEVAIYCLVDALNLANPRRIKIHNDNQSTPLVHKSMSSLIVEESIDNFKLISLDGMTSESLQKSFGLTRSRGGDPRMMEVDGRLLISVIDGLLVFGPQTFTSTEE